MFALAHLLIVAVYAAAPVGLTVMAIRVRRRDPRPMRRVLRAIVGGAAAGTLVCVAHAIASHARPQVSQVLVTGYWATAFILLLGLLDRGLWDVTQRVFRLRPGSSGGPWFGGRVTLALLLRAGLVAGVIIPYVLAVTLTYRPRTLPTTDPGRLYGWAFQSVRFPATDGSRVAGWWIPAPNGSDRTLLLCPGATGGMAAMLPLAQGLRVDGYNLLAFDFRAHGGSGGQLVSYGDLERRDVLGAVRWVQQAHPADCRRIIGLGVSTGAAALMSAAVDPSPFGQAIDALAVYAPFDRLDKLTRTTVAPFAPPPVGWLVEHVGLPLAGLQVGSDLSAYAPADAAANLWPRPLMVLHGMDDELIPFDAGQAVYRAASEPKQNLFILNCRHADLLEDRAAQEAVRHYFVWAQRMI